MYGDIAERLDIDFRDEHRFEPQLHRLGFTLADVGMVIASHLNFDHAGALKQLPHARTFIRDGEMEYARAPERFASTWFRADDFNDRHGIRWETLPCDHDLFGDGVVTALHMPEHTPGSLAAMVRLPGRTVILTGDVVHTRQALEAEVAYHGDVDTVAARRSLRTLAHLAKFNEADVWICHDPGEWQRFGGPGELS